jgi:DNA-binding transcriptional LysR family regulator
MTLDQIQTLCSVVEHGSLKLAADHLHKTQPALSMSLKKLEEEYGFQILTRENYRLTLTEAGRSFYHKALELVQSASQLNSLGQHLGEGNEATLRIGYDAICPLPPILSLLKKCQVQFPNTEVELLGGSRFSALELLKNDQIDLAISPWWPTLYALGDLESLPISHFKIAMVCVPTMFDQPKAVDVKHLKQHVHISVEESNLSLDNHDLILLKGCRQWRTKDAYTLKNMLLEGLGWGHIPEFMVVDELDKGILVKIETDEIETEITGEIRLVKRQEDTLGPVASMIWNTFLLKDDNNEFSK